jgi:flavin reductase (DIM6/NTAB) family NADH-FMN oxidoreductase RutF
MTPDASGPDVRTEALRLITNGVYVLTACGPEKLHAATVTWASQVSFQPPLVMVALRRNSHLAEAVRRAHRFALNILAADQSELAGHFFEHRTAAVEASEVNGLPVRMTVGRCPLLTDAPAWVECKMVAEPPSPGDHALMLGEVTGAGVRRSTDPMVLFHTPWSYGGLR